jgi:hypothetical protein
MVSALLTPTSQVSTDDMVVLLTTGIKKQKIGAASRGLMCLPSL